MAKLIRRMELHFFNFFSNWSFSCGLGAHIGAVFVIGIDHIYKQAVRGRFLVEDKNKAGELKSEILARLGWVRSVFRL